MDLGRNHVLYDALSSAHVLTQFGLAVARARGYPRSPESATRARRPRLGAPRAAAARSRRLGETRRSVLPERLLRRVSRGRGAAAASVRGGDAGRRAARGLPSARDATAVLERCSRWTGPYSTRAEARPRDGTIGTDAAPRRRIVASRRTPPRPLAAPRRARRARGNVEFVVEPGAGLASRVPRGARRRVGRAARAAAIAARHAPVAAACLRFDRRKPASHVSASPTVRSAFFVERRRAAPRDAWATARPLASRSTPEQARVEHAMPPLASGHRGSTSPSSRTDDRARRTVAEVGGRGGVILRLVLASRGALVGLSTAGAEPDAHWSDLAARAGRASP